MKISFVAGIAIVLIFASCSPKKVALVTTDLKRSDFREVVTATGQIQAVNSENIMAAREYYGSLTVERVLPEGSLVHPGDTICVLKCDELSQLMDNQARTLETMRADDKKLEADNAMALALLEAQVKENQAGMSINMLDSVQMRFAPPVRKRLMELELQKARVQERKLNKKFVAQKAIDETEVRQMKARITQAENLLQSLRDKVAALTIISKSTGILAASEAMGRIMMISGDGSEIELGAYPKPGANIYPDLPLMTIPDLSLMQVKLQIQEVDFKRIEKGQKVNITVDAANGLKTTGSVISKSMAARMNYISENLKLKYYEVIVGVDSCHTRMPPGLTARCEILINQVKDTLVVPSLAIFDVDSLKVVYVQDGEKFDPVPVETGISNSAQTIVTRGLTGTETIALVKPPVYLINKPNKNTHE